MRRRAALLAAPALLWLARAAADAPAITHDDTDARFAQLVAWARAQGCAQWPVGARIAALARHPLLLGQPYRRDPLEAAQERLVDRLDGFDCMTFIETLLALAGELASAAPTRAGYAARLAAIRYRAGRVAWCERLHYVGDWIAENAAARRLDECTAALGGDALRELPARVGALSARRAPYRGEEAATRRACAVAIEQRRAREQPLQPAIPFAALPALLPQLAAGDLLAWVAARVAVDVVHLSVVIVDDAGQPALVHASAREGRVLGVGSIPRYAASLASASALRVLRPLPAGLEAAPI